MSEPTKGPYVMDGLCIYGPKDPRSRHKNGRVLIGGVVTERQDWHGYFGEIELPQHTEESRANAYLFAASWDAIEACKLTMAWWGDHKFDTMPCGDGDEMNVYDDEPPMVTAARAAIAKSRGEAQ